MTRPEFLPHSYGNCYKLAKLGNQILSMPDESSTIDLVEIIKQDYQNFPNNQTYSIYAENVYFEDPLNRFQGIMRYQEMIGFLGRFFQNIDLELHNISQEKNIIKTEWTLKMTSPLPWKPRLVIPGWSELEVSPDNLITAHRDFWHIAPIKVLLQNFRLAKR